MLDVDRFSAEELRALDAVEQIGVLNDLFLEIKRLGDEKRSRIDEVADARIHALNEPSAASRALVIDAKRKLDKATVAIATRKEQIKIFQTLLRAVPA